LANLKKSWYNLDEDNLTLYNKGRLKKLLIFAKAMMEETILLIFKNSFFNFTNALIKRIPKLVTVVAPNKVTNEFHKGEKQ